MDNAKTLMEWQTKIDEASAMCGKKMNVAETHKQRLIDAGFVDVKDDIYKVLVSLKISLLQYLEFIIDDW
jgi:thymidine kinase